MVIKQLQKYVKDGDEVLDVGCGSGILSVVALKYGAKHAFGTDLDPNAIIASEENAEQNNIDKKQLEVIEGNIIDDKAVKDACGYECYDIVGANILADVLEPLSTCIHEHMKHGAYFITSGIIDDKETVVDQNGTEQELYVFVVIVHVVRQIMRPDLFNALFADLDRDISVFIDVGTNLLSRRHQRYNRNSPNRPAPILMDVRRQNQINLMPL